MYNILGGDGKQYGPVSAETLQQWVSQGRANSQTRVQAEGTTEWVTLGSLPEFAATLSTPSASPTPAPFDGEAKTSGKAVWSLVCGLTSFLCLPAIPGLILGFLAMKDIKASNGRLKGQGLALSGTIISAIGLLLVPVIAILSAMLLPALAKAKGKAQSINCANNLKQLGLSVKLYSQDNKDSFPLGTNWCDALLPEVGSPRVYQCPGDNAHGRSGYAFNARLSGMEEAKIAPDTVLIFESDAGWNASGGKELMITTPRHDNVFVVCFADGSVQRLTAARLAQLNWDPRPKTP
jgi:prepilin-type processing-associated H-X9-DG protein